MSYRVNFVFAGIGFLAAAYSLVRADWPSAAVGATLGAFFTYVGIRKLKKRTDA